MRLLVIKNVVRRVMDAMDVKVLVWEIVIQFAGVVVMAVAAVNVRVVQLVRVAVVVLVVVKVLQKHYIYYYKEV